MSQQPYYGQTGQGSVNQQPYYGQGNPELVDEKKENVLFGAIGALLLSLVGGAIVFALMQANIIAGIAGFVGFVVTYWGYRKFSGSKGSKLGVVISIVFALASLLGGLFLGYAFQVFQEVKEIGLSFSEALKLTVNLAQTDSGVQGDLIKNALILVGLTVLASFGSVRTSLKRTK